MFTIQTAVTIVTAGLASNLFNMSADIIYWSVGVTAICYIILLIGRYQLLDKVIKAIVLVLTISSILAVVIATTKGNASLNYGQVFQRSRFVVCDCFYGLDARTHGHIHLAFHMGFRKKERLKK